MSKRSPHTYSVLTLLSAAALALFAGFIMLAVWQIERRAWKLDLIERVSAHAYGPAQNSPVPADWPNISRNTDEYRRLHLTGCYSYEQETLVQASTNFGSGFWVITPLVLNDGTTVLVNRGFITPDRRNPATRQDTALTGVLELTGLLRISEPEGNFLHKNDPAAGKWYFRNVQAIGAIHGISSLAPYFVDAQAADATSDAAQVQGEFAQVKDQQAWPIPGLTVLNFYNHHGIYALTWFGLALMVVVATFLVGRDEIRIRQRVRSTNDTA